MVIYSGHKRVSGELRNIIQEDFKALKNIVWHQQLLRNLFLEAIPLH